MPPIDLGERNINLKYSLPPSNLFAVGTDYYTTERHSVVTPPIKDPQDLDEDNSLFSDSQIFKQLKDLLDKGQIEGPERGSELDQAIEAALVQTNAFLQNQENQLMVIQSWIKSKLSKLKSAVKTGSRMEEFQRDTVKLTEQGWKRGENGDDILPRIYENSKNISNLFSLLLNQYPKFSQDVRPLHAGVHVIYYDKDTSEYTILGVNRGSDRNSQISQVFVLKDIPEVRELLYVCANITKFLGLHKSLKPSNILFSVLWMITGQTTNIMYGSEQYIQFVEGEVYRLTKSNPKDLETEEHKNGFPFDPIYPLDEYNREYLKGSIRISRPDYGFEGRVVWIDPSTGFIKVEDAAVHYEAIDQNTIARQLNNLESNHGETVKSLANKICELVSQKNLPIYVQYLILDFLQGLLNQKPDLSGETYILNPPNYISLSPLFDKLKHIKKLSLENLLKVKVRELDYLNNVKEYREKIKLWTTNFDSEDENLELDNEIVRLIYLALATNSQT